MVKDRYSDRSPRAILGLLTNALDEGHKEDEGSSFPISDAEDLRRGALFIPAEVTLARREGQRVAFVATCGPNCWYWQMPTGVRIYHFDRTTYLAIGDANKRPRAEDDEGRRSFEGGAGPCPRCGNPNTKGGSVPP